MRRKEVLFAVIGGIVGAVLVMAAGSFSPLGAQNEVTDVEFGVVTCREIKVVNSDGEARASMGVAEAGGVVGVIGNGGMASMGVNELGGIVVMLNKNFIGSLMCADEDGGRVELSSKDSETKVLTGKEGIFDKITCKELDVVGLDGTQMANIFSHGNGGHVYVRGKDGKALAGMGISEDGAAIIVRVKEGGEAAMIANNDGGRIEVGENDSSPKVKISTTEYGGRVSVHDKEGGAKALTIDGVR